MKIYEQVTRWDKFWQFAVPNVPAPEDAVLEAYRDSLNRHIDAVRRAGRLLGVPDRQLEYHDASKFMELEFVAYAIHFHGDKSRPKLFEMAWLHHIHNNPHHWNHWIIMDAGPQVTAVEMPHAYALEMIADWLGASYAYTGSWNMRAWIEVNYPKMVLHPATRAYVDDILQSIAFGAYYQ